METLNTLTAAYVKALTEYHFSNDCEGSTKWEKRAAYDAMCDAQNALSEAAKAFANTPEFFATL